LLDDQAEQMSRKFWLLVICSKGKKKLNRQKKAAQGAAFFVILGLAQTL